MLPPLGRPPPPASFAAQAERTRSADIENGFFEALNYNDMDGKSQQLDAVDAPVKSFDWVEGTRIPRWLEEGSGIFWISGKPGSGKSVLMNHLLYRHATLERLKKWKKGCLLLHFFFDFRAKTTEANNISGMLKLFLRQIAEKSDAATSYFQGLMASNELQHAGNTKLSEILTRTVQKCDLAICAFVDGVDEYEGDWVSLIELFLRLQDRTDMKFCLASRAEPQLKQLLGQNPMIIMENHNIASIRVYVERALIRARHSNPDIVLKFSESLKDEVMLKAQGIVLWARLAVDELIHACNAGRSTRELQQILFTLPREIKDMYNRILARLHASHATERAMLIRFLLSWSQGIMLQHLFGLWDLCMEDFASDERPHVQMSDAIFCGRLDDLLGTLLDFLPNESIRLLHRTFHDHIRSSHWVTRQLPTQFNATFPYHDESKTRLHLYIVRRAPSDRIVPEPIIGDYLRITNAPMVDLKDLQANLRAWHQEQEQEQEQEYSQWLRRIPVLADSIWRLPLAIKSLPDSFLEPMLRRVLQSHLMLLACSSSQREHKNFLRTPLYAHGKSVILDLIVAVDHDLHTYLKWRLKDNPPPTHPRDIQDLFDISLDRFLGSRVDAETARTALHAMKKAGAQLSPYHLCLLMQSPAEWHNEEYIIHLLKLMNECKRKVDAPQHHVACKEGLRRGGLLFDWVTWYKPRLLLAHSSILDFEGTTPGHEVLTMIIQGFGENLNEPCYKRGTALHAVVDPQMCAEMDKTDLQMIISVLKILLAAGAEPSVTFGGQTAYDYAKQLQAQQMSNLFLGSCQLDTKAASTSWWATFFGTEAGKQESTLEADQETHRSSYVEELAQIWETILNILQQKSKWLHSSNHESTRQAAKRPRRAQSCAHLKSTDSLSRKRRRK